MLRLANPPLQYILRTRTTLRMNEWTVVSQIRVQTKKLTALQRQDYS